MLLVGYAGFVQALSQQKLTLNRQSNLVGIPKQFHHSKVPGVVRSRQAASQGRLFIIDFKGPDYSESLSGL